MITQRDLQAELTQSIISQGQQQPDPQKEKDMRKEVSKENREKAERQLQESTLTDN